MRKLAMTVLMSVCLSIPMFAQNEQGRQMIEPPMTFFIPHWTLGAHVGAAYDIGEAKFGNLISPAAQVTVGYQFNKALGLRFAVSGWQARNEYAYPLARYKWNFIQPTLALQVDLPPLFGLWNPDCRWNSYAFFGGGVALSFNNSDAEKADKRFGIDFQKLWTGHRWNPVLRAGLGIDYRLSEHWALNLEGNVNMLPDHFNSKYGQYSNKDWHFNVLVGVKFNIQPRAGRSEGKYENIKPKVMAAPVREKDPMPMDTVLMQVNIQFDLNKSVIRPSELYKLYNIIEYMRSHPNTAIEMTGYADRETGTAAINERLSRERAQTVGKFLQEHGIDESRMRKMHRGDREQPFSVNELNRVTICFVHQRIR